MPWVEANAGFTCVDAMLLVNPEGSPTIIDNGQTGTSKSGTWSSSGASGYYGSNSLYSKDGTYTFTGN